jgi:Skp family chaperone for outer membrane proteins
VDVARVFDEYRKRQDIEDRLHMKTGQLDNMFKKARASLQAKQDELRMLSPESEKFQTLERELAIGAFLLERDQKQAANELEREARREKFLLYKEINQELAAYGETHGLSAVYLSVPITDDLAQRGDLDLITSTRTVLWHDDRLDITDGLIQVLNAALPPVPTEGGDGTVPAPTKDSGSPDDETKDGE